MLRQDPNSLARRAESLRRAGELAGGERPFALVTVVRTEPATSARIGDRAIVFADGSLDGWVGGGCIGPTARKEALSALEEGMPRLVRVTPEGTIALPSIGVVPAMVTGVRSLTGSYAIAAPRNASRPTAFERMRQTSAPLLVEELK